MGEMHENPAHVRVLEGWMQSYRPEELFDAQGGCGRSWPSWPRRASGGWAPIRTPTAACCCETCAARLPRATPSTFRSPGAVDAEATRVMGTFLRDVMKLNLRRATSACSARTRTTRTAGRTSSRSPIARGCAERLPDDDQLAPDGRVMEMLSEHQCQGWLEGYLLTGRHGFFSCYEAFIHIVDSMFNQHAKWLKVCRHIPWRRPIASLNYLLSSHVWRQDHNGFSHQDPGFIDHVVNKKAEVIRVYLPPDANCLLSVTDHCLRSRNYINVIVAGKQPAPQWLTMDQAVEHCTAGIGIWEWASNDRGSRARRRHAGIEVDGVDLQRRALRCAGWRDSCCSTSTPRFARAPR